MTSVEQTTPPNSELSKVLDKFAPNRKRLAFIGWPDSVEATARISKIEEHLAIHARSMRVVDAGNFQT
eukprot:11573435-Karenia_brevis.AAC.1